MMVLKCRFDLKKPELFRRIEDSRFKTKYGQDGSGSLVRKHKGSARVMSKRLMHPLEALAGQRWDR